MWPTDRECKNDIQLSCMRANGTGEDPMVLFAGSVEALASMKRQQRHRKLDGLRSGIQRSGAPDDLQGPLIEWINAELEAS